MLSGLAGAFLDVGSRFFEGPGVDVRPATTMGARKVRQPRGWIQPTFNGLPLDEAQELLQGVYLTDLFQLRTGRVAPILNALIPNFDGQRELAYQRIDNDEVWRTIRDIWEAGGGDCEDLASAVAAECTLAGRPAIPQVYQVPGSRTAHVMVRFLDGSPPYDPSVLGGMGDPRNPWDVR